jgi:8-hydroxy-5-deazaflavin:NADPH oxidoreductase
MKVAVLGTGIVGRTIGSKLVSLGHEVVMGSRTADNRSAVAWAQEAGDLGRAGTFEEAAAVGDVVLNATAGVFSLAALDSAGAENLKRKVLIDIANPLDFSRGFPPSLSIVNDTSLAEEIQRAHPEALVVKSLNTVSAGVMVNPGMLPGPHNVFLSGNHGEAKALVLGLLESFGWRRDDIVDLGDITTARGVEMYLPLWLGFFGAFGTGHLNIHVVVAR